MILELQRGVVISMVTVDDSHIEHIEHLLIAQYINRNKPARKNNWYLTSVKAKQPRRQE
jgi:hypothetical protein